MVFLTRRDGGRVGFLKENHIGKVRGMVLLIVEPPDQNICHIAGHGIRRFIDAHPNRFVSQTVLNLMNGILVALTQVLLLKGDSVGHGDPDV